jgi:hypothetical protein
MHRPLLPAVQAPAHAWPGLPFQRLLALVVAAALASCASFSPRPLDEVPFRDRARTQGAGGLTVTVAVPTMAQAEAIYGVDLASRGMQPVWLEIANETDQPYWFLPAGLDAHHYGPREAAYAFHRGRSRTRGAMESHFEALSMANPVLPGQTASGFVLVGLDEGYKAVDVDLLTRGDSRHFTFAFADPDFAADVHHVDLDRLWSPEELVWIEDEEQLRAELERLPACTTNKGGKDQGDPLNLVLVGSRSELFAAMVRRGWNATEIISPSSVWRTIRSFLSGDRYRYSPISALYVYGRPQDFSAQKARGSINERNHMRSWLTPLRFRGREVWVGQISRDVGVKFTIKSPTISTHVIDPDVDEARRYFLEDMAYSQSLDRFGLAAGVGAVAPDEPRFNLVGDPYFTDGYRSVMFFEARPMALDEIGFLDWETPGSRVVEAPVE